MLKQIGICFLLGLSLIGCSQINTQPDNQPNISSHYPLLGEWQGEWNIKGGLNSTLIISQSNAHSAKVIYSWGENGNLGIEPGRVNAVAELFESDVTINLELKLKDVAISFTFDKASQALSAYVIKFGEANRVTSTWKKTQVVGASASIPTLNFDTYLPKNFDDSGNTRYPLILFLHGKGEMGNHLSQVRKHGPLKFIDNGNDVNAIIVAPQLSWHYQYWESHLVNEVLKHIEFKYPVDQNRIYLTGLSMGGYATWFEAMYQPWKFAAIAPMAGGDIFQFNAPGIGANFEALCRIKHLPVWTLHGQNDNIIPHQETQQMVDQLRQCGSDIKFSSVEHGSHSAWYELYDDPAFYQWLLDQKSQH